MFRYGLILFSLFIFVACGGSGSPNNNPPVNPPTSSSTLYFGHYDEDSTADPNDPTPGIIYIYLPDTDATFNGEFFFSYVGCVGSQDTGLITAAKTGNSLSGTWSGDVDGTVSSGNFSATTVMGEVYTGSWTRNGGSQNFSFGSAPSICGYTFAGNGDFTLYKINGGSLTVDVDLSNPAKPIFSWSGLNTAAAYRLDVMDKGCLISGNSLSSCARWQVTGTDTGSGLPSSIVYGQGALLAQTLVSGNDYVVTFMTFDTNGNVVDFGSTDFTQP
jgi:hypothetical protein